MKNNLAVGAGALLVLSVLLWFIRKEQYLALVEINPNDEQARGLHEIMARL